VPLLGAIAPAGFLFYGLELPHEVFDPKADLFVPPSQASNLRDQLPGFGVRRGPSLLKHDLKSMHVAYPEWDTTSSPQIRRRLAVEGCRRA
jgi:hypothetical protein